MRKCGFCSGLHCCDLFYCCCWERKQCDEEDEGRNSRNLVRIRRITRHQSRPSTMFNVWSKRASIPRPRSSLSVVQTSEDREPNSVNNVWRAPGLAPEKEVCMSRLFQSLMVVKFFYHETQVSKKWVSTTKTRPSKMDVAPCITWNA